jgi:hypothetical protein
MGSLNLDDRMRMEFIDMGNVRSFVGRDLLRVADFSRDEIMHLLEVGRVVAQDIRSNC